MHKNRGNMTISITKKSKELLGYGISCQELRLMPYIMYVMVNTQQIELSKITSEEKEILYKWIERGFIVEKGASGVTISKNFWGAISEIVYMGYVCNE